MLQPNNPPRRLDIDVDGFGPHWSPIAIFVNGERCSRVLAYDVDEGFVRRVATDRRGAILIEGGEVVEEIVRGHVQVGWRQERARA